MNKKIKPFHIMFYTNFQFMPIISSSNFYDDYSTETVKTIWLQIIRY